MRHARDCGVDILHGPLQRSGARGDIVSFYFYDPDGNLLEISNTV